LASLFQFRRPQPDAPAGPSGRRRIGRFALFTAGAVVAFGVLFVWRKRRQSSLYRREALAELRALAKRIESPETRPDALAALSRLVQSVCLELVGSERLERLSGQEWLELLDSTWPGGSFANGPGRVLATFSYSNRAGLQAVSADQAKEIVELVRRWIREHKRPLQRIANADNRP
jgi:hypothetical protein